MYVNHGFARPPNTAACSRREGGHHSRCRRLAKEVIVKKLLSTQVQNIASE